MQDIDNYVDTMVSLLQEEMSLNGEYIPSNIYDIFKDEAKKRYVESYNPSIHDDLNQVFDESQFATMFQKVHNSYMDGVMDKLIEIQLLEVSSVDENGDIRIRPTPLFIKFMKMYFEYQK